MQKGTKEGNTSDIILVWISLHRFDDNFFYLYLWYSIGMTREQIQKVVVEAMQGDPNKDYIRSISLFGSFLHGDYTSDSDIDLLFEMGKTMSMFRIFETQERLQNKLGRIVDFIEKESLDKYIKDDVLAEAKIIYENR